MRERIRRLNAWAPDREMRALVVALCAWQPLRAQTLAGQLGRTPRYLKQRYLNPLVRKGVLQYTIPEKPQHPDQAYQAPREEDAPGYS